MHDTQSLLTIILESIFVGFGIVIPILSLIRTSNLKAIEVKDLFMLTGVQMVRVAGILYFILFAVQAIGWYSGEPQNDLERRMKMMMFSASWMYVWYKPLVLLLLTQLFWIKRLFTRKAPRIIFAIMLLVLPTLASQQFIMTIISLHRDGVLPSNWNINIGTILLQYLLNVIVFTFIAFTVILAGGKLKKNNN